MPQDWFSENKPKEKDWFESNAKVREVSAATMESRRLASASDFERIHRDSTIGSRAREAAIGVLEPFALQNLVPGVINTAKTALKATFTGDARTLVDMGKSFVTGPIEPIKDIVGGIREGDYDRAAYGAGGFLFKTVPAIDTAAGQLSKLKMPTSPKVVSEELYRSGLKGPTTMPAAKVAQAVRTGIEQEIPISEAGLAKLGKLIEDHNAAIDAAVEGSSKTVSKYAVTKRLGDTYKQFETQVNPTSDLGAIAESGNEFLATQPGRITVPKAQALKTGTYRQLKGRAYGELKSAAVESQKALARGLKEEIANAVPEIKELNAAESKLLNLDNVLERAVNRAANANKGRIGPAIYGGAVGALTGSGLLGGAVGLFKAVLDDPEMASKLAIAINKAQSKNPSKFGPPSIVAARARVAALSGQLAKTSDDSREGK